VGVGELNARMNRDLKYQGNDLIEREFVEYLRYGTNTTAIQLTLITVSEAIIPCIGTRSSISLHTIGAAGAEFNSSPRREPHRVAARLGQRSSERVSAHRASGI
jgi:splicing suppressor protein 51